MATDVAKVVDQLPEWARNELGKPGLTPAQVRGLIARGKLSLGDPELENAVEPERLPLRIGAAPQEPCPQGEPAEIRRQHGGDGVSRHSEDVLEQPRPDHLVDEPGGPRDEEQPVDRAQAPRSAHLPDSTATVLRARSKKRRGAGPLRARPRRLKSGCSA